MSRGLGDVYNRQVGVIEKLVVMNFIIKSENRSKKKKERNETRVSAVNSLETQSVEPAVCRGAASDQIRPVFVSTEEILGFNVRDGSMVISSQVIGQIGGHLIAYDRNGRGGG